MPPDYASLDEAIVKAIRCVGPSPLGAIQYDLHKMGAGRFYKREISLRLQSLRKRGLIKYKNGRWSAVEKV